MPSFSAIHGSDSHSEFAVPCSQAARRVNPPIRSAKPDLLAAIVARACVVNIPSKEARNEFVTERTDVR